MTGKPKNVLLITSDQQRADTLGTYGSKLGATPNLDRLASGGVTFERAHCQHPYCQPSRWTILTGQHPRSHGIWTNGVDPDPEQISDALSTHLAARGWRTGFVGKAHFATSLVFRAGRSRYMEAIANGTKMDREWRGPYMGFDDVELLELGHYPFGYGPWPLGLHYGLWLAKDGRAKALHRFFAASPLAARRSSTGAPQTWEMALPEEFHPTTWIADRTIERIRNHGGRPFFLWASFADPHHPFAPPRPWFGRYDPKDMPLPRRDRKELNGKPSIQKKFSQGLNPLVRALNVPAGQLTDKQLAIMMAAYYGMVAQIDHNVGRILSTLDGAGLAANTLVIYTSDHGELMGDHSLIFKGPFHYDGEIRVPLILSGQALGKGARVPDPVGTIDLAPTISSWLGTGKVSPRVQGSDLLPVIHGSERRESVLTENDHRMGFDLHVQTLTTRRYKLNRHVGHQLGELYDLENDPGEFVNLWEREPKVRRELSEQLTRELPPWRIGNRKPVSVFPA